MEERAVLLEGDLTLPRALELRDLLAEGLKEGGGTVAFGAVGAVDLSFLQLLCAALRSAGAKGGGLRPGPGPVPPVVSSLVRRSGLAAAGAGGEPAFWEWLAGRASEVV